MRSWVKSVKKRGKKEYWGGRREKRRNGRIEGKHINSAEEKGTQKLIRNRKGKTGK